MNLNQSLFIEKTETKITCSDEHVGPDFESQFRALSTTPADNCFCQLLLFSPILYFL